MGRFKNILVVFDSKIDNRALFNQAVDLAQMKYSWKSSFITYDK